MDAYYFLEDDWDGGIKDFPLGSGGSKKEGSAGGQIPTANYG